MKKLFILLFCLFPLLVYSADLKTTISNLPDGGASVDTASVMLGNIGSRTGTTSRFTIAQLFGLKFGTLTSGKICTTDGTKVSCTAEVYTGDIESVGDCTTGACANPTIGGVKLEASSTTDGGYGYASNVFKWYANSEDWLMTATSNLWTFSSSTLVTFAFTPAVGFTGLATFEAGIDVKNGLTSAGFVKLYEDSDFGGDQYVKVHGGATAMTSYDLYLPAIAPTAAGDLLGCDVTTGICTWVAQSAIVGTVATDGNNVWTGTNEFTATTFSDSITITAMPTAGILTNDAAGLISSSTSLATVAVTGGTISTVAAWDGDTPAALTSLTTQNVITTGYISGAMNVSVSSTTPITITAASQGASAYFVNGSDAVKVYNLPTASAGLAYCFANVLYARALTIEPAAGDQIVLAGVAAAAAEHIISVGAATDQICLLAVDSTYWRVTSSTGTWAEETPP